jgi:hypothetical protein
MNGWQETRRETRAIVGFLWFDAGEPSMTEPLRPLSIGELLDRTFSLYRQNFALFVGVSILGPAAMLCYQMALAAVGVGGTHSGVIRNQGSVILAVVTGVIFYLIGYSISAAATVKAVASVYLGKTIRIGEAYARVKGCVSRVVGVLLAIMVIAGLGSVLIIGLGTGIAAGAITGGRVAAGTAGSIVGGVIGIGAFIASILMAVGFAMRYALSVQACVVEELGVGASLKRSRALTKDARKRVVTVIVVCTIVIMVLAILFGGLSVMALSFVVPRGGGFFARQVVAQIARLISGVLGAPLMTIAMSLVYYDERVRKEAFDLQFMMESLDEGNASAAPSLG